MICEQLVAGLADTEARKMNEQAPAVQLQALLPVPLHKLYPANRYAACHHTAHDWFLECVCASVHACVRQPLFHVQDQLGRTVQLCFVCLNSHVLLYCPPEATGTQTAWLLCLAITSTVLAGLRHLRDQQFEQQHTDLNTLCVCCSTRPSPFLMPYLLEPVCFLPSCGPREENTVAYN